MGRSWGRGHGEMGRGQGWKMNSGGTQRTGTASGWWGER
jgi:hypothetical protein